VVFRYTVTGAGLGRKQCGGGSGQGFSKSESGKQI